MDRLYMTAVQAHGPGRRLAAQPVPHARARAVLRRHLLPARRRGTGGRRSATCSRRVRRAWTEQRARIEESGGRVLAALRGARRRPRRARRGGAGRGGAVRPRRSRTSSARTTARTGGFGGAPKFPSVGQPRLPAAPRPREPRRARARARARDLRQLDAMRAGGIHDHLGGGFHRYSTDARLAACRTSRRCSTTRRSWPGSTSRRTRLTGRADVRRHRARHPRLRRARPRLARRARSSAAEDADSEGEEGRFYVWTPAQTAAVLGAADAALFDFAHGVTAEGNFEDGASVLHRAHTAAEAARALRAGRGGGGAAARRGARAAARGARPAGAPAPRRQGADRVERAHDRGLRPRRATCWATPSLAGRAPCGRPSSSGRRCATRRGEGALLRRWCDGRGRGRGAARRPRRPTRSGCSTLYQATRDPLWLERAAAVTGVMVERFEDEAHGRLLREPAGRPAPARAHEGRLRRRRDRRGNSLAVLVLHAAGGAARDAATGGSARGAPSGTIARRLAGERLGDAADGRGHGPGGRAAAGRSRRRAPCASGPTVRARRRSAQPDGDGRREPGGAMTRSFGRWMGWTTLALAVALALPAPARAQSAANVVRVRCAPVSVAAGASVRGPGRARDRLRLARQRQPARARLPDPDRGERAPAPRASRRGACSTRPGGR